jgi:hypothetical protein
MRLSNDQENDSALTSDMVLAVRKRWNHFPGHGWVLANFSRDVDRGWSAAALLPATNIERYPACFRQEAISSDTGNVQSHYVLSL